MTAVIPREMLQDPGNVLEELVARSGDGDMFREESDISKLVKRQDLEFPKRQMILKGITKSDRVKKVSELNCLEYFPNNSFL